MMIVDKDLLNECIEAWGIDAQTDMAIEEMAELTKALLKMRRVRGKPLIEKIDNVREEIADVLMMMQQMRLLYGAAAVDDYINMKTDRLLERLKEKEGGN